MTRIIKCPGHDFEHPDVNERLRGKRWKCRNCGLKVSTREAAITLQGRTS